MTSNFAYASKATIGRREAQQDSGYIVDFTGTGDRSDPAGKRKNALQMLAVLADGMGGQGSKNSGAVASEALCNSFVEAFTNGGGTTAEKLEVALDNSNKSIAEIRDQQPELGRLGTTVVGATIDAKGLSWISVGDSHLYLVRGSKLQKLNEDHSEAGQRVAAGTNEANDPELDQYRHRLESAIMGDTIDLIDLQKKHFALKSGDVLVLASDGLDTLSQEQIGEIVERHRELGPDAVARELINGVEAANLPNQDNTLVIVIAINSNVPDQAITVLRRPAIIVASLMVVSALCGALFGKLFLSDTKPTAATRSPPAVEKSTATTQPTGNGQSAGTKISPVIDKKQAQQPKPVATRKAPAPASAPLRKGPPRNLDNGNLTAQPGATAGGQPAPSPLPGQTGNAALGTTGARAPNPVINTAPGNQPASPGNTDRTNSVPARQVEPSAQIPAAGANPNTPEPVQPVPGRQ